MKDSKKPIGDNYLEQIINEMVLSLEKLIQGGMKRLTALLNQKIAEFIDGRKSGLKPLKLENKYVKKVSNEAGVLGYSISSKRLIEYSKIEWKAHTLVTGASGTGKTNFLLTCTEGMMRAGKSIVMIDPKNDIEDLKKYRVIARKNNAPLSIFMVGYEGEDRVRLNPFKHRLKDECETMMGEMLPKGGGDSSYYYDHQFGKILDIIDECYKKGEWFSLPKLRKAYIEKHSKCDKCEGMINRLRLLVNDVFMEILDGEDARSLDEIIDCGESVYIGLNFQRFGNNAKTIAKLFTMAMTRFSGFRQVQVDDKNKATRATLVLDEAGSVIVGEFLDFLNKCRSSNIEVFALTQTFNDLAQAWKEKFSGERSVTGNISNYVTFRLEDDEYVQFVAKSAGTTTVQKRTRQINDGMETGGESVRDSETFLVHPNIIRNLRLGQAVMVNKRSTEGQLIELMQFRDIENDPQYCTKDEKLNIKGLTTYRELKEKREKEKSKNIKAKEKKQSSMNDSYGRKLEILMSRITKDQDLNRFASSGELSVEEGAKNEQG